VHGTYAVPPSLTPLPPSPPLLLAACPQQVGGTPAVLKYLNAKGFLNAECKTVTCEWYMLAPPPRSAAPLCALVHPCVQSLQSLWTSTCSKQVK